MGGGDRCACACGLLLSLEETDRGGFIARSDFRDLRPGVMRPIPQIIGWMEEDKYQSPKLFE